MSDFYAKLKTLVEEAKVRANDVRKAAAGFGIVPPPGPPVHGPICDHGVTYASTAHYVYGDW